MQFSDCDCIGHDLVSDLEESDAKIAIRYNQIVIFYGHYAERRISVPNERGNETVIETLLLLQTHHHDGPENLLSTAQSVCM